jgi:hypothetical protein
VTGPDRRTPSGGRTGGSRIAVTATFTAQPILPTMRFWLDTVGVRGADLVVAPTGQVVQQLLALVDDADEARTVARFVMVRWEDSLRLEDRLRESAAVSLLEQVVADLYAALLHARERTQAPIVVAVFPPSPACTDLMPDVLTRMDEEMDRLCGLVDRVDCVNVGHDTLRYPVPTVHDEWSDRLGRIPYTDDYYMAAGTVMARRLWNLLHNRVSNVVADTALMVDHDNGAGAHPWQRLIARELRGQDVLGRRVLLWTNEPGSTARQKIRSAADLGLRWRRISDCRTGDEIGRTTAELVAGGVLDPGRTVVLTADSQARALVERLVPDLFAVERPPLGDRTSRFVDHAWFLDPGGDGDGTPLAPGSFRGFAEWSCDMPSIRARVAEQEVA